MLCLSTIPAAISAGYRPMPSKACLPALVIPDNVLFFLIVAQFIRKKCIPHCHYGFLARCFCSFVVAHSWWNWRQGSGMHGMCFWAYESSGAVVQMGYRSVSAQCSKWGLNSHVICLRNVVLFKSCLSAFDTTVVIEKSGTKLNVAATLCAATFAYAAWMIRVKEKCRFISFWCICFVVQFVLLRVF